MEDLMYQGRKALKFQPVNHHDMVDVIAAIHAGMPQVVILEPGDATRYTLLLMPLQAMSSVTDHLGEFGIEPYRAHEYMYVARLDVENCPGTWVPFGENRLVERWNVEPLGNQNVWSERVIAWWLTELYKLL